MQASTRVSDNTHPKMLVVNPLIVSWITIDFNLENFNRVSDHATDALRYLIDNAKISNNRLR